MTEEEVKARAAVRKTSILASKFRIEKKLAEMPNDQRAEGWSKRLAEYDKSLEFLEIELKYGRPFKIKGNPSKDGVNVSPNTGQVSVNGG